MIKALKYLTLCLIAGSSYAVEQKVSNADMAHSKLPQFIIDEIKRQELKIPVALSDRSYSMNSGGINDTIEANEPPAKPPRERCIGCH